MESKIVSLALQKKKLLEARKIALAGLTTHEQAVVRIQDLESQILTLVDILAGLQEQIDQQERITSKLVRILLDSASAASPASEKDSLSTLAWTDTHRIPPPR